MVYPMVAALNLQMMLAEANAVIALRMMGLAGVWSVAPSENGRMWTEKPPAFAEAAMAAWMAGLSGAKPEDVVDAWVKPLRRKTRANHRRLAKRGPNLSGPNLPSPKKSGPKKSRRPRPRS